jgi:hypothetical protein
LAVARKSRFKGNLNDKRSRPKYSEKELLKGIFSINLYFYEDLYGLNMVYPKIPDNLVCRKIKQFSQGNINA